MTIATVKDIQGFSLVELVLVISIIGILTAISTPKVNDIIENVREKAVVERLNEDLNYIRSMAISYHDTTWLVVDQAQNSYGLYIGPTAGTRVLIPDPQTGDSFVLDLDSAYQDVVISSVSFGGASEVSFNWWGTPSSGGTVVLNSSRTVSLLAETGLAYETP